MRFLLLTAALALGATGVLAQTAPAPDGVGTVYCSWMKSENRSIGHAGPRHFERFGSDNGGIAARRYVDHGHTVARDSAIMRMTATDEDGAQHAATSAFGHTVGAATALNRGLDCTIGGSGH